MSTTTITTATTATAAEAFEALWSAKDVAAYLKASRSWVYQKAESGLLPSLRVCGLLRFEPATVRAFARGEYEPSRVLNLSDRIAAREGA